MDATQRGVARGIGCAALIMLLAYGLAAYLGRDGSLGGMLDERLMLAALALLAPALELMICIGRLAKHRFFTPEDIHGSGVTAGSERARLLQALLQNTLEQSVLAAIAYIAAALLLPAQLLGWIPAAATMFLIGRGFFYAGYGKGAPSRAFGFGLTFYPTVVLLLTLFIFGLLQVLR